MEASCIEVMDENKTSAAFKIDSKLAELQKKKKLVDEQVKELQQRLIDKLEDLMEDSNGPNQDRKMKMMFLSLVASIFSFSVGFRTNFAVTSCRVSWPLLIGGGAVAYSLYCLKSVLFAVQQHTRTREIRKFLFRLAVEAVKGIPNKYTLDARFKPYLSLGMPADLFSAMLKEETDESDYD